MEQGAQPVLCDNPGGWGGGGGGREAPKRGDMCVPMTDSLDVGQKATQYCKAIILRLKINSKKESRALQHGTSRALCGA